MRRKFYITSAGSKSIIIREVKEEFRVFKMEQQMFQKDDGLPIRLKGGLRDKILAYTSFGLAGLGLLHYFGSIDFSDWPSEGEEKE